MNLEQLRMQSADLLQQADDRARQILDASAASYGVVEALAQLRVLVCFWKQNDVPFDEAIETLLAMWERTEVAP